MRNHLSANACFLGCPQGIQRCLLCCGETPNSRNIDSFVGSIAPQGLEILAIVQIPEHNGSIIPTTGKLRSIGAYLDRLHCSLMRLLYPYALSAVDLPPAQHAVTASTDQHLSTRTPGHRKGHPRMPYHGLHLLPAGASHTKSSPPS